jgi:hypothetical protein
MYGILPDYDCKRVTLKCSFRSNLILARGFRGC